MSDAAQKLLEQIRALPEDDRRWIADQMAEESDGGYDPLEDPEFRAELDRRIEAAGNGTLETVGMAEAMAELERAAAERRSRREA